MLWFSKKKLSVKKIVSLRWRGGDVSWFFYSSSMKTIPGKTLDSLLSFHFAQATNLNQSRYLIFMATTLNSPLNFFLLSSSAFYSVGLLRILSNSHLHSQNTNFEQKFKFNSTWKKSQIHLRQSENWRTLQR